MVALGTQAVSAYDPWALQSRVGLTDARLALDSVLMPRTDLSYVDYRSGVMVSGDGGGTHMACLVRPAPSGLAVTVEVGNVVINTPGQGAYMCALDSRKTLALAASSATTNRIDLVIARVYDDLNPAIASSGGARKFVVEVWTGDPATGTPTTPVPTPSSGWHPLATVRISKGVVTVTDADIGDERGPGLVARGGMRALYGADAETGSDEFTAPGAYPGEQRWVHGNGFQHQVYYGVNDDPGKSGWRGVHNGMLYEASPTPNDGSRLWARGPDAVREVCRVRIDYPGTPFMVFATGRTFFLQDPGIYVEARVSIGSATGLALNWTSNDTTGAGTGNSTYWAANVAPMMYGPFTETTDLVLNGRCGATTYAGYGWGFRPNDGALNWLSVMVYPSTVQPERRRRR